MVKPIFVNNISLLFPHKTCFEEFSTYIHSGTRIAIMGRNGSGKTSLLRILQGNLNPTHGRIEYPPDVRIGFVPQHIEKSENFSGAERFNKALTEALSLNPSVLLLDEPTNHLDEQNRRSLLRMLKTYAGILIIVSHDTELLRHCVDTLWHIDNARINVFSGHYDDYIAEIQKRRNAIEQELLRLKKQKKSLHQSLMQEQERASKSRIKGEKSIMQRKWPTVTSKSKALQAEETSGRKKSAIDAKKQALTEDLINLRLPEVIIPTFSINALDFSDNVIISVQEGLIGYPSSYPILRDISLSLEGRGRMAITGPNGSGKSTLMKAIAADKQIIKGGEWTLPKKTEIGYLDQHYSTLDPYKTVLESVQDLVPDRSYDNIRRHLSDFLFFKNEEVNAYVYQLSGGEKARLVLAQIAAKTPKVLLLDEITNNLDLEAKQHVIEVLKSYPGALLVISHDPKFLEAIDIEEYYRL